MLYALLIIKSSNTHSVEIFNSFEMAEYEALKMCEELDCTTFTELKNKLSLQNTMIDIHPSELPNR